MTPKKPKTTPARKTEQKKPIPAGKKTKTKPTRTNQVDASLDEFIGGNDSPVSPSSTVTLPDVDLSPPKNDETAAGKAGAGPTEKKTNKPKKPDGRPSGSSSLGQDDITGLLSSGNLETTLDMLAQALSERGSLWSPREHERKLLALGIEPVIEKHFPGANKANPYFGLAVALGVYLLPRAGVLVDALRRRLFGSRQETVRRETDSAPAGDETDPRLERYH